MKLSFSSSSTLDFSLPLFYTFPSHTVPSRETDIIRTSGVISKSIEETEKRKEKQEEREKNNDSPVLPGIKQQILEHVASPGCGIIRRRGGGGRRDVQPCAAAHHHAFFPV